MAPLPAGKVGKDRDTAGRGFATQPGLFRLDALLAQPIDRGFFVAAGFLQRLFAFHHGQAGTLAQRLTAAAVISAMLLFSSNLANVHVNQLNRGGKSRPHREARIACGPRIADTYGPPCPTSRGVIMSGVAILSWGVQDALPSPRTPKNKISPSRSPLPCTLADPTVIRASPAVA